MWPPSNLWECTLLGKNFQPYDSTTLRWVITKVCGERFWKNKKIKTNYSRLSLNGHLELVPAFLYSFHLTLYKTNTSLRRTLSAGPKGVRLRESWLYLNKKGQTTRTLSRTTAKHFPSPYPIFLYSLWCVKDYMVLLECAHAFLHH